MAASFTHHSLGPVSNDEVLRRLLRTDSAWQGFAGNGRTWVCPVCLQVVQANPHSDALGMLTAIRDHLREACLSAGNQQPSTPSIPTQPPAIQPTNLRRTTIEHADTAFHLEHDPAWQCRLKDGRWVCPGCLEIQDFSGEGSEVVNKVLTHRRSCAGLAAGAHTTAEVDAVAVGANVATCPTREAPSKAIPAAESEPGELEQLRAFQRTLMYHPPTIPGFHFATSYDACTNLSGDFNQFVTLEDGRLAIAQGDISGHGTRAGLLMAIANKLVELFAKLYADPRQVAIQIQRSMADDLGGYGFLTMSYGVLDPKTRILSWIRAGHGPSLLWHSATGIVETLQPSGMIIGMPVHEVFARALSLAETQLEPGDIFLFSTDGLCEAMNEENEEFGMERIAELMASAGAQGPDAVIEKIRSAVDAHRNKMPVADDQSLIAIGVDPS